MTNLNIEEIKQICNEAIDYLQIEGKKVHKLFIDEVAAAEIRLQKIRPLKRNNSEFFDKIEYATRFALNLFAIYVLNVEPTFVDFKDYKKKKKKDKEELVYFGHNTIFQCRNRVVGEIPNTLENARFVINKNDQDALIFYRWLLDVAYNNKPIWQDMFKTFKTMGVRETYEQEDMSVMHSTCNLSSPDNVMENGLRNLLDNRSQTKKSGMTR